MTFGPEADPGKAEWSTPQIGRSNNPWILDLKKLDASSNRVAYARAQVWSPKNQKARLDVGSDDAVKVWLNGGLVHANLVNRGVTKGERGDSDGAIADYTAVIELPDAPADAIEFARKNLDLGKL